MMQRLLQTSSLQSSSILQTVSLTIVLGNLQIEKRKFSQDNARSWVSRFGNVTFHTSSSIRILIPSDPLNHLIHILPLRRSCALIVLFAFSSSGLTANLDNCCVHSTLRIMHLSRIVVRVGESTKIVEKQSRSAAC